MTTDDDDLDTIVRGAPAGEGPQDGRTWRSALAPHANEPTYILVLVHSHSQYKEAPDCA